MSTGGREESSETEKEKVLLSDFKNTSHDSDNNSPW